MNNGTNGYLFVLKNRSERSIWGMKDEDVLLIVSSATEAAHHTAANLADRIFAVPAGPCLWCYEDSVSFLTSTDKNEAKQNLRQKLPVNIRIFHHAGGMVIGDSWERTRDDFEAKGFWKTLDVIPHSSNELPWTYAVEAARKQFVSKTRTFDDSLLQLDRAWGAAVAFYEKERPMQTVLETLFAPYVDVCNLTKDGESPSPDLVSAIRAAKEAWTSLPISTHNAVERIIKGNPETECEISLLALKQAFDSLSSEEISSWKPFRAAYECFSRRFTEMLGLPGKAVVRH